MNPIGNDLELQRQIDALAGDLAELMEWAAKMGYVKKKARREPGQLRLCGS